MKSFNFKVDENKCIGCGLCIRICSTANLYFDENNLPKLKAEADGVQGWDGCYRCQRCMAVCPQGAVSILNKDPEDSVLADNAADYEQLAALMRNRRACRNYLDKEVPREVIDEMLALLENAPTGSNFQTLGFNVVYKKAEMDKFRKMVRDEAFRLAEEEDTYPGVFNREQFLNQVALEPKRNPGDMFFVGAPHILVIHSLRDKGQWRVDPVIAATWFDLICASKGLASTILTFPVGALSKMPEIEALLQVPEDRFYCCIMAFGYPDIKFARGVQREGIAEVKELCF